VVPPLAALNTAIVAAVETVPELYVHVGFTAPAVVWMRYAAAPAKFTPLTWPDWSVIVKLKSTVAVVPGLSAAIPVMTTLLLADGVTEPGAWVAAPLKDDAPFWTSKGELVSTPLNARTSTTQKEFAPLSVNVCPVPTVGFTA